MLRSGLACGEGAWGRGWDGEKEGVAMFPYVWVRALGNGGEGEVVVVQLRWGPEFAGQTEARKGEEMSVR